MRPLLALWALLIFAAPALAKAEDDLSDVGGEVRVPLSTYTQMLQQLAEDPRPAPAAYALGQSQVTVQVDDTDDTYSASVHVTVLIETFEDEWTLVPVLASGAALERALVNGRPVQLVQTREGLAWSTDQAGVATLQLSYGIDARRSDAGFVLPLPVPEAAATQFRLSMPGSGHDLAIVPSSNLKYEMSGDRTYYTASLPSTSSILVSWRAATKRPYAVSRAAYSGELLDDALVWRARYQVKVFSGEVISLPLMPNTVTLKDIRIDGEIATVLEDNGHFTTLLEGRGAHDVEVSFQVPVIEGKGPPRATLLIPRIPVSRFDLTLPGRKDVMALPKTNVTTSESEGQTLATTFVPMTDRVTFSWTNAIPGNLQTEVRANASLYHVVHAEEGVLQVRGLIAYEITHGETSELELEIPNDAQVNRIVAPAGGISDWAVAESKREDHKTIKIFLEQAVSGAYLIDVDYERLLGADPSPDEAIAVPFLRVLDVHRQRGMVALLSGQDLALEPVTEDGVSRVGENQLPAFVRNQIDLTVAHTYKYLEPAPGLTVTPVTPERRQGKFDAQVDTLISLGEVTMKGSATVEIDVKSGSITDLRLGLPSNVNILAVSGPSLRSYEDREIENGQVIDMEFTREMEGQFRVEVTYERIMEGESADSPVPTLSVMDAEVEHGRIAVEALTAVEVQATTTEQLSSLDVNELPQQLVLKTTNPILLAYRYVHAKPPFALTLKITRHQEIEVQVAAIERAAYSTLITRDGLAVTTARLTVRNSRRQFLRMALPKGSEVWSVFVDGKPEKPAFPSDTTDPEATEVLVKMINASDGFPVDIVYATPVAAIEGVGSIASHLPRPDMVVTHSRWDVFLPIDYRYYRPDSTMDLIVPGVWANPMTMTEEAVARASDAYQAQFGQPLRIIVPTQGIQFSFEKLYANQSAEDASFSLHYVSADANMAALFVSALGTVLIWIGIVVLATRHGRKARQVAVGSLVVGLVLLLATIGYMGTNPLLASVLTLAIAALWAIKWGLQRLQDRRVRQQPA